MYDEAMSLKKRVLEELEWEPSLNAAQIGVAVTDGVVTLSGTVGTYAEKLAAERATKRIKGVRAMAEEIDVRLPTTMKRTDTDLAKAALDALAWDVEVPKGAVKMKVEDGWLTLEGEVEWGYQKEAAMRSVRYMSGVRGVTNLVTVRPRVQVGEIKAKIAQAFKRSAELEANRLDVEAIGGRVTLSGSVHSWEERDEANRIAWAAPGVAAVDNRIAVSP
jgi:osmotically-inducible protein OsmY